MISTFASTTSCGYAACALRDIYATVVLHCQWVKLCGFFVVYVDKGSVLPLVRASVMSWLMDGSPLHNLHLPALRRTALLDSR